jgi:hypothetical protein
MKQCGCDPTCQRHSRYSVSKRSALERRLSVWGRERRRDAAACPERACMVAPALRVGSAGSVSVSTCINDSRVPCPYVLDIDLEFAARGRQKVSKKDIARFRDTVEELAACRMRDIYSAAALAAVRLLHQEIHAARSD